MIRRPNAWMAAALVFLGVNVGGGWVAAAQGEPLHAGAHFLLLLPGAYFAWWLATRRGALGRGRRPGAAIPALRGEFGDHLTQIEQSIDAVAIEVERIGEGQRFMTRLFTEKGIAHPAGDRVAEPSETDPQTGAPRTPRK